MLARARGAIELYPLFKTHRDAVLPRQAHQFFDAIPMRSSRNNQRIERPVGFERFAYGVNSGEAIHTAGNLQ